MDPQFIYKEHAVKLEKMAKTIKRLKLSAAELVFDMSFVVNFIVGKLIHVFSQKEEVYNYYNNKGNILNQWFVKKGWGWTTVAIIVFYSVHIYKSSFGNRGKVAFSAFLRWAIATAWWILFTQWCFGHPIMDKVFLLTGGKCARIPEQNVAGLLNSNGISKTFSHVDNVYESVKISSYHCRKLRGSWEGGHDPSGHVFLLVHASLYMFHEVKEFWPGWIPFMRSASVISRQNGLGFGKRVQVFIQSAPHAPVMLLLSLWWFMLLVTNMYFHSLSEKLIGLFFGYLGVLAVYYFPRYLRSGVVKI